uniref:Uncharacterized protein n=1 Tax=Leptobrachium leishanense TaxID=445787 RepID=A0A8C5Q4Q7_9ANUR
MASSKTRKTAEKSNFFTPKSSLQKCSASSQDGGGSPPASPESHSGAVLPDLAAFASMMEGMLATLSTTLTSHLDAVSADKRQDIKAIGDRTAHLEDKMADMAEAHHTMAARVEGLEDMMQQHASKIADLEDRSRRHNLKIRGISETVHPKDLTPYVTDLFSHLLPGVSLESLLMDRIHSIPKPPSAPSKATREVILQMHYFKPREDILKVLRNPEALDIEYAHLAIFPDLSKATLQQRRNYRPFTTALRDTGMSHRWGYPTKLIVHNEGTTTVISSIEEGPSPPTISCPIRSTQSLKRELKRNGTTAEGLQDLTDVFSLILRHRECPHNFFKPKRAG